MHHEESAVHHVPLREAVPQQASAVHGLQAGLLHQDGASAPLRVALRALHGRTLRSSRGLQASAGHGLLPRTLLPSPLPKGLLPEGGLLPESWLVKSLTG